MKEKNDSSILYKTGEKAPEGQYSCNNCKRRITLKNSGCMPPCPKCSKSEFKLKQATEMTEIENAGNYLRTLRLGKGLSTKDVTQATRISETNVHAIEDQDFSSLPADTFTRGLLTIYAEFLDADPKIVVAKYMEERHTNSSLKKQPKQKSPGKILAPKRLAEPAQISSMTMAGLLLVIIIVSFAGYCFYNSWNPFSFLSKQNGEIQSVMESVFPLEETVQEAPPPPSADGIISIPADQQHPEITPTSSQAVQKKELSSPDPAEETAEDDTMDVTQDPEVEVTQETDAQEPAYTVTIRFLKDTSIDITRDDEEKITLEFMSEETHSWSASSSLTLTFAEPDSAEILVNDTAVNFPSSFFGNYTLKIPRDLPKSKPDE